VLVWIIVNWELSYIMKAATIQEIKQELTTLSSSRLTDYAFAWPGTRRITRSCSLPAFRAGDEAGFIRNIRSEIDLEFEELPRARSITQKKACGRSVRTLIKRIKYTGSGRWRSNCWAIIAQGQKVGHTIHKNPVLTNLYSSR